MKKVALTDMKGSLSHYLAEARKEEVVITKHGKPVGVLIGFASEADWHDYLLESDPAFATRIARARDDLRAGRGTRPEDVAP
jgi:prevent-host-death family protein